MDNKITQEEIEDIFDYLEYVDFLEYVEKEEDRIYANLLDNICEIREGWVI